jgi:hypothetical protein
LKLIRDDMVSSFAFNFDLRPYTKAAVDAQLAASEGRRAGLEAGAYTRPLLSST